MRYAKQFKKQRFKFIVAFMYMNCQRHEMHSANNVPIAAPIAPALGIKIALEIKLVIAPANTDWVNTFSIFNGIRYCVLAVFENPLIIITGDSTIVSSMQQS